MTPEQFEVFNHALAAGATAVDSLRLIRPDSAVYVEFAADLERARKQLVAMGIEQRTFLKREVANA